MNVNAGIQVSLAVTCLLSGEFASQANLAGFTRDALTLAVALAQAQTGTAHALCSHSHSFKPLQIYV